jgi:hypothetical protein
VSASSDDHYSPSEVVQRQDSSGASSGGISKHASPPSTTVGDTGGGVGTSNGQLQRWCWGYGGDFGNKLEQMSDGPFCMNGLVDADRTLHPGTAEVRVRAYILVIVVFVSFAFFPIQKQLPII